MCEEKQPIQGQPARSALEKRGVGGWGCHQPDSTSQAHVHATERVIRNTTDTLQHRRQMITAFQNGK
eukprot:366028-Chlamydomonas_euryale.AAC.8